MAIYSEHSKKTLLTIKIYLETPIILGVLQLFQIVVLDKDRIELSVVLAYLEILYGIIFIPTIYKFLCYKNKKIEVSKKGIICTNSLGRTKKYPCSSVKKAKISDFGRYQYVKIIFNDGYKFRVSPDATRYSEFKEMAKEKWTKKVHKHKL